MRITNRYMTNSSVRNIQLNLGNLARSQEQLSTSKRILRPSDDPNSMGQFLSIKSYLTYMEQYNQNIDDGLNYLNLSDSSMGTLGDILAKANEYTIQAANDTYSAEQRAAIARQIDKMIDQVVDLGNSSVGDKFIYAGTKNDAIPFKRVGDTIIYSGDTNEVRREVLAGTSYRIDSPGIGVLPDPAGVFGLATGPDINGDYTVGDGIFKVLFDLRDRLDSNDTAGLQSSIGELKDATNDLLSYRVQVGARASHFETMKNILADQEVKLTENLNNIEGADMARLSIEYSQQLLSYEASLAAGAKILQVSLLDFLR